jgi:hypothetical protein
MKRRVYERGVPPNLATLKRRIRKTWGILTGSSDSHQPLTL